MEASLESDTGYSLYEPDNQVAWIYGNSGTGKIRKITVREDCTIRKGACILTETGPKDQAQRGLLPAMHAYEIDRFFECWVHVP